jgi:hypothetical protein
MPEMLRSKADEVAQYLKSVGVPIPEMYYFCNAFPIRLPVEKTFIGIKMKRNVYVGELVFGYFNAQPVQVDEKHWYLEVSRTKYLHEATEFARMAEDHFGVAITIIPSGAFHDKS